MTENIIDETQEYTTQEYIIFDIDVLISFTMFEDKNIKVFPCESQVIFEKDEYKIIHKKIVKDEKIIDIFLTYQVVNGYSHFLRGYLYYSKKEYKINHYTLYNSLKIYKKTYDLIGLCSLDNKLF